MANTEDQDAIYVSATFLRRAAAHIKSTGQPLLMKRLPGYARSLEAWPDSYGGYQLNVPYDEWEPPFRTWREYGEFHGLSEEEVLEESGLEDEDELDEEIETDALEQLLAPGDTVEGHAEALLADLPPYLIENVEDIPELLEDADLEPWRNEGGRPGWTQVTVEVPSALALSVLQYILDEVGHGTRIELKV